MEIIPAIDLKAGKCVRLTQGQFDQTRQYSDDPLKVAKRWRDEGATRLHIVDLDGARVREPRTRTMSRSSRISFGVSACRCRSVGNPHRPSRARRMVQLGIDRVIIGTAAVSDPLIGEVFRELGEHAVLGLDARGGMVAIEGWQSATGEPAVSFAVKMAAHGVRRIIFTDIAVDGMLTGPNVAATQSVRQAVSIPVIASGGVGIYR